MQNRMLFSKCFVTIEELKCVIKSSERNKATCPDVFSVFERLNTYTFLLKMIQYNDDFFIKPLHDDFHSEIENNGHLSKNIALSRDCHQRDPLSP